MMQPPSTKISTKKIEAIQKQFLKYFHYKLFQYYPQDTSYDKLLSGFEMESLKQRREAAELTMIHDLLSDIVRDINLLPLIRLRVPTFNIRYGKRTTFRTMFSQINHVAQNPTSKILSIGNGIVNTHFHLDFFGSSRNPFKKEIKKALSTQHQN